MIENTEGHEACVCAHGLSFYVETEGHKLLLDLGPSADTLYNAEKLGIDLAGVDIVILSHGHYDHSGGIMPFVNLNPKARIYMQKTAVDDYYADDGESAGSDRYRYIGIDKAIAGLPEVVKLQGDHRIDDELELFTIAGRTHPLPSANRRLLKKSGDELIRDDFDHEQYLVINNGGKKILMSGCAHNGMLSILDAFEEKYGTAPDVVISGFHLMKKRPYRDEEITEIEEIANILKQYPTSFFTCHCTGEPAYDIMKHIMGDKLKYVHSGEEVGDVGKALEFAKLVK